MLTGNCSKTRAARSLPPACDSLRHLDPDDIYLLGTVAEGSCGQDALTHWSNPNVGLTGFYWQILVRKYKVTVSCLTYFCFT